MKNLLYEIIPPPESWSQEKVDSWINQICSVIKKNDIQMVNIPEVISETRDDERTIPYRDKMDNLEFSQLILDRLPTITPILNKITVRQPLDQLMQSVQHFYQAGIRHLVLVGGEHAVIRYPGPSVSKAAQTIKEVYPDMILGGITIFTRRDEAKRIESKHAHGIDFFISQIIFETANMKRVMLNLKKFYDEKQKTIPKIYLSLAPATKKTDVTFMQWLGVEFPSAIYSYFVDENEDKLEERVFEVIDLNLEEMNHFTQTCEFDLGFNLEQVMYSNHKAIDKLIQKVKRKFKS